MKIIILTIFSCFFSNLTAQSVSNLCIQRVKEFNKINDSRVLPEKSVFYVNYNQKITMWDKNTPSVSTDVKVWANKYRIKYITNDIEVYQDNRDVFMIIHSKKKVIWGQSEMKEGNEAINQITKITALKDTLISLSTIIKCETIKKENMELLRMILKFNGEAREQLSIDQMEYNYDNKTGNVVSVITDFVSSHEVKRMEVHYLKNENDYKGVKLDRPVSEKIVGKDNLLLPYYKYYQLIDNR